MFLSKLILNPKSREARRDLANPYDLHRTLARAFAPDEQTAPGRFLWRLEPTANWQQPQLLVQSQTAGNWGPLHDLLPARRGAREALCPRAVART